MHRLARTVTALSLAALVAGAAPVHAKSPHSEQRGGKKPVGEIVSFDAATSALVVELADGEDLTVTVAEDARVKLEHRGSHRRSKGAATKGHGNPSNGSLDDLVAGARVLRMKIEDEEVTKIRLRPAPAPAETPAEGDQSQDGTGGEDVAEDPASDDSGEESPDDDTDANDDTDTPDDGESGDV